MWHKTRSMSRQFLKEQLSTSLHYSTRGTGLKINHRLDLAQGLMYKTFHEDLIHYSLVTDLQDKLGIDYIPTNCSKNLAECKKI